jgi:predicted alpha/beta superfamily hydrolase
MLSSMLLPNHLYYLGPGVSPAVVLQAEDRATSRVNLVRQQAGRRAGESLWQADLTRFLAGARREWQFRIDCGNGHAVHPTVAECFTTELRAVWVQDEQLFSYRPAPEVSPGRVVKIDAFAGALSTRPLYIYLPRGFDEHGERRYPVIYMHDGQNCFDACVADSYAGAWQADIAADFLIRHGLMQECLVVGVSHGREQRIVEYLPPYATVIPPSRRPHVRSLRVGDASSVGKTPARPLTPVAGRADLTFRYYRDDVAPYVEAHYRAASGRDQRATCGSSMGGIFSLYIMTEYPEFARNHAALSSSLWTTRTRSGTLEAIERLRAAPPHDTRLWLDSGTQSGPGNRGDDGMRDTQALRDALLEAGYQAGVDFQYYLDEGGRHNEASWAARLPLVFQFLFPAI